MAAKSAPKKNLSAIKRARQTEKRNVRNKVERTKIKSVVKEVEASVKGSNKEATASALLKAIRTINSAASKGIVHKNNASRKISRMSKKANAVLKAGAV